MKIARQRHKNQNYEKNGTYVKDNGVLRMPTNFFDDPTIFGDRSPKKPKKAIFDNESAGRQYARGILLFFWDQILSQITSYAWILKIKDQFKVSCKKLAQNLILAKKLGWGQICPPPRPN